MLDRTPESGDNGRDRKGDVRMKRFLCGWLCLCLLLSCVFLAFAENAEEELTEEEKEEVRELDEEDDSIYEVTGRVYPEPTLSDFNASSPAIYTGRLGGKYSVFAQMDSSDRAKRVSPSNGNGRNVDILYVGLTGFRSVSSLGSI